MKFLLHFSTNSPASNPLRQQNYNLLDKQKQWGQSLPGSSSVRDAQLVSILELEEALHCRKVNHLISLLELSSLGVNTIKTEKSNEALLQH